jgi:hypothetical protein
LILMLLLAAVCFGCTETPTGPTAGELEAQRKAAAEAQRAEAESRMRQLEEARRHESDEAAQRFSMLAVVAVAVVVLIIGVLIGMGLGLKTREDHRSQQIDSGGPKSAVDRKKSAEEI